MRLSADTLSFNYGTRNVLRDFDTEMTSGNLVALIGPNGCGKSTLLRCLANIQKPKGVVRVDGRDVSHIRRSEYFGFTSYVPQRVTSTPIMRVFEAILLGRVQTLSWRVRDEDLSMAWSVLEQFGIQDWASRHLNELSGGQRQLVSIAQAFAKQPRLVLLDEPTSNLDMNREFEVLELLSRVTKQQDILTIVVIHNLNTAARFADEIIVLHNGIAWDTGSPAAVLTAQMLEEVYGMHGRVLFIDDEVPTLVPLESKHR